MSRNKIYISIIILLISTTLGINVLLKDTVDNKTSAIGLSDVDVYTTTSTSTTSETTTTSTVVTTSKVKTTTTKSITKGTLSISGYDKVWSIAYDDTYDLLTNGNSIAVMDSRLSFNDRKMIIYGHSHSNGRGLFNYFQNYDHNIDFYNNHKYLYVNYEGINYTYEIFSVYSMQADTNDDDSLEYYNIYKYYDDVVWYKTLKKYKEASDYDTGVSVNGKDKILIIQTCSINPNIYKGHKYANLLIMAKLK